RHAAWCAAFSEDSLGQLHGGQGERASQALEAEAGNLEVAWSSLAGADVAGRTQVALALDQVGLLRGTTARRLAWLTPVLDEADAQGDTHARARLHMARGRARSYTFDLEPMVADLRAAADLAERVGDGPLVARALTEAAHQLGRTGRRDEAVACAERARDACPAPHNLLAVAFLTRVEGSRDAGHTGHAARVARLWAAADALEDAALADQAMSVLLQLDHLMTQAGDDVGGQQVAARLAAVGDRLPDKGRRAIVWVAQARVTGTKGRYHDAVALLRRARADLVRYGRSDAIDQCDAMLYTYLTNTFQLDAAFAAIARYGRSKALHGDVRGVWYARLLEALARMIAGELDVAAGLVAEVHDATRGIPFDDVLDSLVVMEALVALGRRDRAAVSQALAPFAVRRPTGSNGYQADAIRVVAAWLDDDDDAAAAALSAYEAAVAAPALSHGADWRALADALRRRDGQALAALAAPERPLHGVARVVAQVGAAIGAAVPA
ncbi:MAG: hypothetical protein H6733_13070, partial [Alphaproteobacteria bacterium]|nr:hypothetical protein [Alphaproteobacteria bacterium]